MSLDYSIRVLRQGPTLAALMPQEDVLYWSFCATGQAYCPEPLSPPPMLSDANLIEPLGGSLLHLLLRPPLKHIEPSMSTHQLQRRSQLEMLDKLLSTIDTDSAEWAASLKARDLFGLRAVDYIKDKDVLRGLPLEHSVSIKVKPQRNYRGIIRSLTKEEMANSDLFSGLKKARNAAGLDLYPGISTAHPTELRRILLDYHDTIHWLFGATVSK